MLRAHSYNVHHLRILKLIPPSLVQQQQQATSTDQHLRTHSTLIHTQHTQKKRTHISLEKHRNLCVHDDDMRGGQDM